MGGVPTGHDGHALERIEDDPRVASRWICRTCNAAIVIAKAPAGRALTFVSATPFSEREERLAAEFEREGVEVVRTTPEKKP